MSSDQTEIEWAMDAIAEATTVERLLCLKEVIATDAAAGASYTQGSDFRLLRKAWLLRFDEFGGDTKSSSFRDTTKALDGVCGKHADGANLHSMSIHNKARANDESTEELLEPDCLPVPDRRGNANPASSRHREKYAQMQLIA